jgi:hypothetical protein
MEDSTSSTVPESGLVDSKYLGEHTPFSRSWFEHARLIGEGPPHYRLCKKVVYRWTEVRAWLDAQLAAGTKA